MEEIWKDIEDYEGLYQISNLGRIFGIKRDNILLPSISNRGYKHSTLSKNNKRINYTIHRLVAQAFIPNPNNLPQVNHIDGNKLNNNVSNLEWCDASKNNKHAYDIGLKIPLNGIKSPNSKLTTKQINSIRSSNLKQVELAKMYYVSTSTISLIKNNKRYNSLCIK